MTYKPKYFKYSEFDSHDEPGSGIEKMDQELVIILDKIRESYGKPIRINSAYRSSKWNKRVGGSSLSQHLKGRAVDIPISNQEDGDELERLFITEAGENNGIGRYNTFIHVDIRGYKARWFERD